MVEALGAACWVWGHCGGAWNFGRRPWYSSAMVIPEQQCLPQGFAHRSRTEGGVRPQPPCKGVDAQPCASTLDEGGQREPRRQRIGPGCSCASNRQRLLQSGSWSGGRARGGTCASQSGKRLRAIDFGGGHVPPPLGASRVDPGACCWVHAGLQAPQRRVLGQQSLLHGEATRRPGVTPSPMPGLLCGARRCGGGCPRVQRDSDLPIRPPETGSWSVVTGGVGRGLQPGFRWVFCAGSAMFWTWQVVTPCPHPGGTRSVPPKCACLMGKFSPCSCLLGEKKKKRSSPKKGTQMGPKWEHPLITLL